MAPQENLSTSPRDDGCRTMPSPWAKFVSGSVGSIITALAVTPLEVVKVRQQAAAPSKPASLSATMSLCPKGCGTFVLSNGLTDSLLPKSAVSYFDSQGLLISSPLCQTSPSSAVAESTAKAAMASSEAVATTTTAAAVKSTSNARLGTFAMMRKIFVKEGFSGIYSGLGATLIMGVPNTVLYFVTYDELISKWRTEQNAHWIPAFAGGSARIVASAATAPFELVRTRQAAAQGSKVVTSDSSSAVCNSSILREFRTIIQTDGTWGLYKGLSPTLLRDVPFSAIYWLSLERLRLSWKRSSSSDMMPSPLEQFGQALFNGSTAGMFAAACTTPLDVVKTRKQTAIVEQLIAVPAVAGACDHSGAIVAQRNTIGTISTLRTILQEEGLEGLWRGNVTRMIKVAPACAIMLSSYELGKRMLTDDACNNS